MNRVNPSEITPEQLYVSRRRFIKDVGAWIAGSALLSACAPLDPASVSQPAARGATPTEFPSALQIGATVTPSGQPTQQPTQQPTSYETITTFNNFYEFTLSKTGVASAAEGFKTSPWTVEVGGLVNKPQTFDVDDLRRKFDAQERIYRLRCVEAWSMVVPWLGFPLADLLREVEPISRATYVRFETLYDPEQMPGQARQGFDWPYVEGLRLDEAMHDLTLLATGIYGEPLLPQNGAPVRLVVPWKYGFKSIKSIVRIDLVEEMPVSFWMAAAPREYGFYANVNPDVPHPRWSQATERRIGEDDSRETVLFNGYAEEVAHLYAGMDLRTDF